MEVSNEVVLLAVSTSGTNLQLAAKEKGIARVLPQQGKALSRLSSLLVLTWLSRGGNRFKHRASGSSNPRFMQELQDDPEVVRAAIKPLAQAVFWCSQKQRVFRMPDKLGLWFWCDRGDVKANLSSIPMEEKNPRATDYI